MSRTNIAIDEALIQKAMALSGVTTKREVVDRALREFVWRHSAKDLLELEGCIRFAEGYDYKLPKRDAQVILVDTSVLIDFLKGRPGRKTEIFRGIMLRHIPFGFSAFTYQGAPQGARDEAEFARLDAYMSTQRLYCIPETHSVYSRAGKIYFDLRRLGITVRSSIDTLIALTAIDNGLHLLHNDSDFDMMAAHVPELRILPENLGDN